MNLPDYVRPIEKEAKFKFKCHAGLKCFTDCCRELELALSPYDLLRLKKALSLTSGEFLERHAVIEFEDDDRFPRVYLGMVDDGKASCPFVKETGCIIYIDRPGACRTYPVGRGASMAKNKQVVAKYVLMKEPHCHGFDSSQNQTIDEWEEDQQIKLYNRFNDELMVLSQHPKIKTGQRLSQEQADQYVNTLYDIDRFREIIANNHPSEVDLLGFSLNDLLNDDTILLSYAIQWFAKKLF